MKRDCLGQARKFAAAILLLHFTLMTAWGQGHGQVLVWGDAGDNDYSDGSITNVPDYATNLCSIAGTDFLALGLTPEGKAVWWGDGYYPRVTEPLSSWTNLLQAATGAQFCLALRSNGVVAMSGSFWATGVTTAPAEATNVVTMARGTGAFHALLVRADGSLFDFGYTINDPSLKLSAPPPQARHIVSAASGTLYALALRADGRVIAWGENFMGTCNVPASATNIVAIAAAQYEALALRADGTILTWGMSRQSGITGFTNLIDVFAPGWAYRSSNYPVLGLRRDGTVVQYPASPLLPANATNITAIAATSLRSLALIGAGRPVFPSPAINRTVVGGQNAYFFARATGAMPISCQWSYNGEKIAGATNLVYVVTNATPDRMGAYSLMASNTAGTAVCSNMMLTVLPADVLVPPQSLLTNSGATVALTLTVEGAGLSYQWLKDGEPLEGATNVTLVITNALVADSGNYSVVLSNGYGQVTSVVAQVGVVPILVTAPLNDSNLYRYGTMTLKVGAISSEPIQYQWQWNGTNIAGANTDTLVVTNLQYVDGGDYAVLLSNSLGATNSRAEVVVTDVAAWGKYEQSQIPADATNLLALATFGGSPFFGLKADGTVVAWGKSYYDQLQVPADLTNIIALAAGSTHCLALRADGRVEGWGNPGYDDVPPPADLTNAVAVAVGYHYSVALRNDGTIAAWSYGGVDESTNLPPGLTNVVAIASSDTHILALRGDGHVVAWGRNNSGEIIVPADLQDVIGIACGGYYSMALLRDGRIRSWGATDSVGSTPAAASNLVALATSGYFAAALRADGQVVAWGYNSSGATNVPAALTNVLRIATGTSATTLALIGDGPPVTQAPLSAPVPGTNGIALQIASQSGRVYRLEYVTTLTDTNWTALPLVAGNGSTFTLTDPTATNAAVRYYQVKRW